MNRVQEDTTVDLGTLADYYDHRVIRSHRAPRSRPPLGRSAIAVSLVGALMAGTVAPALSNPPESHTGAVASAPADELPPLMISMPPVDHGPEFDPTEGKLAERTEQILSGASRSITRVPPQVTRIEKVIRFALAQVGDPYVWAADGPNAYDCSGLVLRAYSQIGIKLPHFTGAMVSKGKRISKGQLRRGDIIFPSNHHVGIYLGGGKMVHSPKPGDHVKVSKVYSFYTARRIL